MKDKQHYQVLYNNVLLPRKREIVREEEQEAFDGIVYSILEFGLRKKNRK